MLDLDRQRASDFPGGCEIESLLIIFHKYNCHVYTHDLGRAPSRGQIASQGRPDRAAFEQRRRTLAGRLVGRGPRLGCRLETPVERPPAVPRRGALRGFGISCSAPRPGCHRVLQHGLNRERQPQPSQCASLRRAKARASEPGWVKPASCSPSPPSSSPSRLSKMTKKRRSGG